MSSTQLRDFPEWLGASLVREMRQGMRSGGFLRTFLILQTVQAVFALALIIPEHLGDLDKFYLPALAVVFLLIMPLRAFSVLREEVLSGTMEPLLLTGVSARRIVWGKWSALFVQTLLTALTVLPVFLARYYSGGVDIAGELIGLLSILALSAIMSAAFLAVSWIAQPVVRFILGVGLILPLYFGNLPMMFVYRSGFGSGGMSAGEWAGYLTCLVIIAGWYLIFLLESAGDQICPAADRQPAFRRLAGIVASVAVWLMCLVPSSRMDMEPVAAFFLMLFILGLTGAEGLCGIARDPRDRGMLRSPTWFSGLQWHVLFLVVCTISALMIDTSAGYRSRSDAGFFLLACASLFGQALMPLLYRVAMRGREDCPPVPWIGIQLVFGGICIGLGVLGALTGGAAAWLGFPIPGMLPALLATSSMRSSSAEDTAMGLAMLGLLFTAVYLAVLLGRGSVLRKGGGGR